VVQGLLVTHGGLGRELIRTAEAILGPQSGVQCLSNVDSSLEDLAARIQGALAAASDPAVVFVDLLGGSCGHACRPLIEGARPVAVFSGVNLPMLLEFFYHRDRVSFEELKERLLRKGRDGICAL
jgi:mannose/fructose-specific phosphotransferase system component IIA